MNRLEALSENRLDQIKRLTQIGVALSAEKNIDKLLEMIIDEARRLTGADGGTLYVLSEDAKELLFAIVQNDTLSVRMGGTADQISWPSVTLRFADQSENRSQVSAYAALTGEVVNIEDVYDAAGFNFEGTRNFDAQTGYRSKSMLVVPMRNHEQDIIGVVQLLNAIDPATGDVVPFSPENQLMAESLASQAAVALSKNKLILNLETLLKSFITTIATAVDEKSPYTGGHVRRVASLTMAIAEKINEEQEGPFAGMAFDEEEMQELYFAAWLHDVGKITTPEYVVDKATKLESIWDRINVLKTRAEVMIKEREIEWLRESFRKSGGGAADLAMPAGDPFIHALHDDLQFLERINIGGEFLSEEMMARLRSVAQRQWRAGEKTRSFIEGDELENLSIRRGTLTDRERNIINNHAAVTFKMLCQLPFPKKLRNVPEYAAAHHEKLDGTGYPLGLNKAQLSLQSRILALADVFEALTAKDRPYKKGKTLNEALIIMKSMVRDQHIDADLFDLFLNRKIYLDYAQKELSPQQIDAE